jgi:hypothetical protein
MNYRTRNAKYSDATLSSAQSEATNHAKFEIPIEFDDILTIVIFDSALRMKRGKFRSRSRPRRPK